MDARKNEEALKFVKTRRDKIQENNFRQQIKDILQNSDKTLHDPINYKLYIPKEITKKFTICEKKAIYEIALSDFQSIWQKALEVFKEFMQQGLHQKFKIDFFHKLQSHFLELEKKSSANIFDLIPDIYLWYKSLKEVKKPKLTESEKVLFNELIIWLEGLNLHYTIISRRKEVNALTAKKINQLVPSPVDEKKKISAGQKDAIIKIYELNEIETSLNLLAIIRNIMDQVIIDDHNACLIVMIYFEIEQMHDVLNQSMIDIGNYLFKMKDQLIPNLNQLKAHLAGINITHNIVPLFNELEPWLISLYYSGLNQGFAKKQLVKGATGLSLEDINIKYYEMAQVINSKLADYESTISEKNGPTLTLFQPKEQISQPSQDDDKKLTMNSMGKAH